MALDQGIQLLEVSEDPLDQQGRIRSRMLAGVVTQDLVCGTAPDLALIENVQRDLPGPQSPRQGSPHPGYVGSGSGIYPYDVARTYKQRNLDEGSSLECRGLGPGRAAIPL